MKRLFWFGIGVAVTVVAARQVARLNSRVDGVARVISPAGLAGSISSLAGSITEMTAQLRSSMAENERALRNALLPSDDAVADARRRRAGLSQDADERAIFGDDTIDYF